MNINEKLKVVILKLNEIQKNWFAGFLFLFVIGSMLFISIGQKYSSVLQTPTLSELIFIVTLLYLCEVLFIRVIKNKIVKNNN